MLLAELHIFGERAVDRPDALTQLVCLHVYSLRHREVLFALLVLRVEAEHNELLGRLASDALVVDAVEDELLPVRDRLSVLALLQFLQGLRKHGLLDVQVELLD